MQATILILDGVSTSRIMLRVQLSAAFYRVVLAENLDQLDTLLERTRPDLVIASMSLSDGSAIDVQRALTEHFGPGVVPLIALTAQNDQSSRLKALAAGVNDVLSQPYDDMMLQARVRSLLRDRTESRMLDGHVPVFHPGLAEPMADFAGRSRIALVTEDEKTGAMWIGRLGQQMRDAITTYRICDIARLMTGASHDAYVIELSDRNALRLAADLRARSTVRNAAVIGIAKKHKAMLAADALDRGAHDVMQGGFEPEELALRLRAQLRYKARLDRFEASLRDDLRAASIDPMTGLYNRRYALPRLAQIARDAARTGNSFALLLADLDHFKLINDQHGHLAGDAVLVESARRLKSELKRNQLIARIGGEEFMIVLPDASARDAVALADRMRHQIHAAPFRVSGTPASLRLSVSIGATICTPDHMIAGMDDEAIANLLIGEADRALYSAKDGGRNRVSLFRDAA